MEKLTGKELILELNKLEGENIMLSINDVIVRGELRTDKRPAPEYGSYYELGVNTIFSIYKGENYYFRKKDEDGYVFISKRMEVY